MTEPKISLKDVEHVARLARLELSDADKERMRRELDSILSYIDKLRGRIGRSFPTALASFPYVDYHPAFPYSVFLGPGGARFNQRAMKQHFKYSLPSPASTPTATATSPPPCVSDMTQTPPHTTRPATLA